jgi:hypothetical protein
MNPTYHPPQAIASGNFDATEFRARQTGFSLSRQVILVHTHTLDVVVAGSLPSEEVVGSGSKERDS